MKSPSKKPMTPAVPLPPAPTVPAPAERAIEVYFSPRGGCQNAIVNAINQSQRSIFMQAYGFSAEPIVQALIRAHQHNVRVEIILDKSNLTDHLTKDREVAQAAIPIWTDSMHAIAHNKIIIIDNKLVITGSYNFTEAAEKFNAENVLFVRGDRHIIDSYKLNWDNHRAHSKPWSMIDKIAL